MNEAHWHLMLNHVPIIGVLIGMLVLAASYVLKNNDIVKKTALGIFVFTALAAIPGYLTGEGAEEIAEKLPGVSKDFIETHEDKGKIFLVLSLLLGVVAIVTFIIDRAKNKIASTLYIVLLVTSIGASIYAQQVGTSGGEIRHSEIRSGAGAVQQQQGEQGHQKDDD